MLNDDIGWNENIDPHTGENIENGGKNTYYYIGLGIAFGSWVWSWLDARSSAIDYNEELKKKYKLSFTPKLNKYSKQSMLGININF